MYRIDNRIEVKEKVYVTKSTFINEETRPFVNTFFRCSLCNKENYLKIEPYKSGFPIMDLYSENEHFIEDMLENNMVKETSKYYKHYGEYTVNELPTFYFGLECESCTSKYIVISSFGEKQPSLDICYISGVWKYIDLNIE